MKLFYVLAFLMSSQAFALPWRAEKMGWMGLEHYCNRALYDADYYTKKGGVREQSNDIKDDVNVISRKLDSLVGACDEWTKAGPNANCNTCKKLDTLKREMDDASTLFESYRVKVSHFDGELGVFRDFVAGLGMADCQKAIGKKGVKSTIDYPAWKERNLRVFRAALAKCESLIKRP